MPNYFNFIAFTINIHLSEILRQFHEFLQNVRERYFPLGLRYIQKENHNTLFQTSSQTNKSNNSQNFFGCAWKENVVFFTLRLSILAYM